MCNVDELVKCMVSKWTYVWANEHVHRHNLEGDAAKVPVDSVRIDEVLQVIKEKKLHKPLDIPMYHWR